ncbi:MAG: type II secretion system F family protein [Candidatus Hydrogenedentes bacterium]|nr:type II secretion system F family protein [Candidatus Hydrogenedentota bacterium]
MPNYRYRAVDRSGKPAEGTMTAETSREVIKALEQQELAVSAIEPAEGVSAIPLREKKLTADDLNLLNEQVHAILKSGLPLSASLQNLADDIQNPRLRPVINDLQQGLDRGEPLSDALERHPQSFSPVYRALVGAGEQTGNLTGVFQTLTTYSARSVEFKNRLQETLAYPLFVFFVALAVGMYFLLELFPSSTPLDWGLWNEKKHEGLASIANLIETIGYHRGAIAFTALGAALLLAGIMVAARSTAAGQRALQALGMRTPVIRKLLYDASIARFSNALGMLLASRVPLPESVSLAAAAAGNPRLLAAANNAVASIQAGHGLSESLSATRYFSNTYCWLLRNGEERGAVEQALLGLAEQAEREADKRSRSVVACTGSSTTS